MCLKFSRLTFASLLPLLNFAKDVSLFSSISSSELDQIEKSYCCNAQSILSRPVLPFASVASVDISDSMNGSQNGRPLSPCVRKQCVNEVATRLNSMNQFGPVADCDNGLESSFIVTRARPRGVRRKRRASFVVFPSKPPCCAPNCVGLSSRESCKNCTSALGEFRSMSKQTVDVLREADERRQLADGLERNRLLPVKAVSNFSTDILVRKLMLLYFQRYPINEMITDEIVTVGGVGKDDGTVIPISTEERVTMTLREARKLAREHGLDLVKVQQYGLPKANGKIAVCYLLNHKIHSREWLRYFMAQSGVQPGQIKETVEVGFRGGTHPFMIRVKAIAVAKYLFHRRPVVISLTNYGTPREGFPVFENVLREIRKQCEHLKAWHTSSRVKAHFNEIVCYLHPSTPSEPISKINHPHKDELDDIRDCRLLQDKRDIEFEDWANITDPKERNRYHRLLDEGVAWAYKCDGLTLQKQRRLKVMLGFLPKGNAGIYSKRGDVELSYPFHASYPTTIDKILYPRESNLQQAQRGAAAILKRYKMPISYLHDAGETEEKETVLESFDFRVQGGAVDVGAFKEQLGLKRGRKRVPVFDSGFATLGVKKDTGEQLPVEFT